MDCKNIIAKKKRTPQDNLSGFQEFLYKSEQLLRNNNILLK